MVENNYLHITNLFTKAERSSWNNEPPRNENLESFSDYLNSVIHHTILKLMNKSSDFSMLKLSFHHMFYILVLYWYFPHLQKKGGGMTGNGTVSVFFIICLPFFYIIKGDVISSCFSITLKLHILFGLWNFFWLILKNPIFLSKFKCLEDFIEVECF